MSNTDNANLARFEAVAHQWWDPNGDFRPLHDLNPTRLAFISARTLLAGANVLDVGCGGGLLSESMAQAGAQVTGIDAGETAIEVARLHAIESGSSVRYEQAEVEQFGEPEEAFDIITCMEMLEHVPDPKATLAACYARLKPGGSFFAATIHRNLKSYLFAIIGAEYLLKLLPRGMHDYEHFIRPSEFGSWLRQLGFELREISGMSYDPFARRARLSRDVSVNYLLHAVKPRQKT